MSQATIKTETFTCPSCIKKIETAVGGLDGVDKVDVGFNSSRVKVDFDPAKVALDKITKTIDDLGYQVLSTKVK